MNFILGLIILGLIIMHFGFWSTVGAFFVTIFWIVIVIVIIFAFIFAMVYIIEALSP